MTIAPGIDVPSETIADLCRRYQVREMSVFGSAARGEMRADSDIDILVELEPEHTLGLFEFMDLEDELTRLFGRKADLASKEGLNRHRAPYILQEARVIYSERTEGRVNQ